MLSESSKLWRYISSAQQDLIREGYYLLEDSKTHTPIHPIRDYSYLVFPFAKAYEGFLKQWFLDKGLIKKWQYVSDGFRIGRVLSPTFAKQLKRNSVYTQLQLRYGSSFPDELWRVWKKGRNLVFHYFPENYRALTPKEAEEIIEEIIRVMDKAVDKTRAN